VLSTIKNRIVRNIRNIPGWRTNRKIIIFESDDWGAIRMPSKSIFNKLLNKGIKVDQNPYNINDSLESNDDLEALFEVLTNYKDAHGKHPVFTALSISDNPDFDNIKKNNFESYQYESVLTTLERYGPSHDNVYQLWKQGIAAGIFYPEFHGREHINVNRWMKTIRNENSISRLTFDAEFYGLSPEESNEKRDNHFPAFDIDTVNDIDTQKIIIKEGLELFTSIYGYKARFFVPPNFLCNHIIEEYISNFGIHYLTGSRKHIEPLGENLNKKSIRYTGLKNKLNQRYIVRNSQFEYAQTNNPNEWKKSLLDIETAFFWKKPAIISTHRLNYIGCINEENRKKGLQQLDLLLENILKKWPDVEFMSTSELGDLIVRNEK